MSKLLRMIFSPYVQDEYGAYYHSGVGYSGYINPFDFEQTGRHKHRGVGYGGFYE